MGKVKRVKRGIAAFIASDKGQRFFNFAYSIGAAIVIWGALFKILHLPGGNALLSIGMGTEVLMFVLTAFDRPPREYKWEEVFPALDHKEEAAAQPLQAAAGQGGGVVIVGGTGTSATDGSAVDLSGVPAVAGTTVPTAEISDGTLSYAEQMRAMADELRHLRESTAQLNEVSDTLLAAYRSITLNSDSISDSSTGYVEQMQTLNRNIQGLNTIYEIQLKSVSSQLDAIDRVNRGIKDIRDMYEKSAEMSSRYCEETEKMARYMQQLNSVYEKMITAMTINMYRPMMGTDVATAAQPAADPVAVDKPGNQD